MMRAKSPASKQGTHICTKLLNAHHSVGMTRLMRHKKSDTKYQGQPDICQSMLSQSSMTSALSSFSYDVTRAHKVIIRYVVLKNNSFIIIEDSHYVEMIREGFAPVFICFLVKLPT